jgi:signal transduction histidine kinase
VDALADRVPPAGQREYRSVVAELERLEALLDGMLAFAAAQNTAHHVVAGDGEQDVGCPVLAVVQDRIDAWAQAAARGDVRLAGLSAAPPDGELTARCPERDLAQILDVLLDNGIRYAGQGATITVAVQAIPGRVQIVVTDDGPGLTAAERALATTRFWRGSGRGAQGSGLGLAIAAQLAEAHHGDLQLGAGSPSGLAVTVCLPTTPAPDHGGTDRHP